MRAKFSLDGCYEMSIDGDVPRCAGNPASVHLQIDHHPLPVPQMYGPNEGGPAYVTPPTECVAVFSLKPSQARAVASALLSAATEAKE